jgi:hypothetical protein
MPRLSQIAPAGGPPTDRDDLSMARLRQALAAQPEGHAPVHLDDHQVLALLGPQAAPPADDAAGLLRYRLAIAPAAAGAPPPPASSGSAAGRAAAAAPPPAAVVVGALSASLDVAAMVQTLRDAARDGVPFCEECERARQQRAAEAA